MRYLSFKSIKSLSKQSWQKLCGIGLLLSVNFMVYASVDPAQDMLTGAKTDVNANFGQHSTFMWLILFIEVVYGAWKYVNTKSLASLIGVFVLMIFTSVAFVAIGS